MALKFRSLQVEDAVWITEIVNDPEASKYINYRPRTEHEIREAVRKHIEEGMQKFVVAELQGEPAGVVNLWFETGRCGHVAWLGIKVRRKHWGKCVGSGLMEKAINLARQLGYRKLMLGVNEGNERAMRLYQKFGFEIEAYYEEDEYIDGSWGKSYFMSLELAPCEPKFEESSVATTSMSDADLPKTRSANINVRHLMDRDLDELHRLQNCPGSTKSTKKVPPITKEETKRWYEELKSREGKYCFACFEGEKLLGYLRFRAGRLPAPHVRFEEIIVDVNQKPRETSIALIKAIKDFRKRYGYRKIYAHISQTSSVIIDALEDHGFKKAGAMRCYKFIDGHYVDVAVYGYP